MQTPLPLDADSLQRQSPSPGYRPPPEAENLKTDPPVHVTCDAGWEANPPHPMDRQTNTCENITLPQLHLRQ